MRPQSSRKGRDLELLVKRIKEHQSPGSKVTSPEYVPDVDTGLPREVDIGIRIPLDNGSVFIAVECRDRISNQGVDWIEQLISKKSSICADVLIAVTGSRFSKPARVKALKHGIILERMSEKLPEEIAQLGASFFITISYLAPKILGVELQLPVQFTGALDSYRYKHITVERELSLEELARLWTTLKLVRTFTKYVEDWHLTKNAKIELVEIDADVLVAGVKYPISGAKILYQLNFGEFELPLRAVQELAVLDGAPGVDTRVFVFGPDAVSFSEVIADAVGDKVRWDVLGRNLLAEGKVLIGANLRASKPVSITSFGLDV